MSASRFLDVSANSLSTWRALETAALHPLLGRESASFAALTADPRWREVRATLGIDSTV